MRFSTERERERGEGRIRVKFCEKSARLYLVGIFFNFSLTFNQSSQSSRKKSKKRINSIWHEANLKFYVTIIPSVDVPRSFKQISAGPSTITYAVIHPRQRKLLANLNSVPYKSISKYKIDLGSWEDKLDSSSLAFLKLS